MYTINSCTIINYAIIVLHIIIQIYPDEIGHVCIFVHAAYSVDYMLHLVITHKA